MHYIESMKRHKALVVCVLGILIVSTFGVLAILPSHATSAKAAGGRGASLPYVEYEAEAASTNATVIGPDRTYLNMPSEASGREAVKLSAQGQYVEFTLTQPANAIDLRYSIPDSSDGAGLTAPLSLYINGTYSQALTLTSKYSWVYGAYPYPNTPSAGSAHHFFDESRALLGSTLAAGTKVRLQVDAADTAAWYVIDLADFYAVPAAYTQPASGYISITSAPYNADPTGGRDATQAIQNAVNAASSSGQGVWIPAGTFTVTSHITLNNVTVRGAGPWYSILHGNGVGMYGNGGSSNTSIQLYDFAIFGETITRIESAVDSGVGGSYGNGSVIQNLWIEHTKAGIWIDGPSNGLQIVGVTVRDTFADGIHLDGNVNGSTVKQSMVRNTGDDALALWSNGSSDQNDTFAFNTVQLPILANGIGIYGGSNNSVTDNIVADTVNTGGGVSVANAFGAVALGGTTTVARNTLLRTGSFDRNKGLGLKQDGAVWLFALDSSITGAISVTDNEIDDSTYAAIHFLGANGNSITNATFSNDTIKTAGTYAIQEEAPGSASFSAVTATGLGLGGQYNCGTNFTITQGSGNSGWSDVHCGSTTITPTPTSTPQPVPPGTQVLAINAGGGTAGGFVADTGYNQGSTAADTSTQITTSRVSEPVPQAVWQTVRWNSAFTYTIPGLTPGATYTVALDWADLTFQGAGQRQFNVAINGKGVLSNFDVTATVGYKTALQKQFAVAANGSGQIVIAFTRGSADNPFINGIEIWGSSNGTPTPTPTATSTPTPTNTPTPTPTPSPGAPVIAINAGGGTSGNFVADTDYDQGHTASDTSTAINTSGVSNPAPQAVYQTARWNSTFTYTIPGLKAGASYTVRLDWADLTFQGAGQRQFNVAINGRQVLSNFDVTATAGYKKALAEQFAATANGSGQIVIAFTQGAADNPFINGIEIWAGTLVGTQVTAINAGGGATGNFVADTGYNQGHTASDTSTAINTSGVSNPAPQAVYQTARWNSAFTYTLTGLTPGASYTLKLDWAELTFQGAGQRQFNVAINGNGVLSNFDVTATGGYKTAVQKQFTVTANSSGQVVIAFSKGTADNPFISGIELYTA